MPWPDDRILPEFAAPASPVDLLDMSELDPGPSERLLVTVLQGLINKTRPRIMLVNKAGEGKDFWIEQCGLKVRRVGSPWELLAKYAHEISGVVLYSSGQNPHVVNLATTIAGIKNALPIEDSLFRALKARGIALPPVSVDLRKLKFGTPIAVYEYLYKTWWKDCNKRLYISLSPNNVDFIRDLAVATRSAVIWLDIRKHADSVMADKFFSDMRQGRSFVFGWWPEERSGVGLGTSHGIATVAADFFENATVFAGQPRRIELPKATSMPELANKIYVTIYLSDGDNIQYCQHSLAKLWRNEQRGSIPINWTISPALVDAAPQILNYYERTATANDCLVSGPSGVGYALLYDVFHKRNNLTDNTLLDKYTRFSEPYLERAGLRAITIWDDLDERQMDIYAKNCRYLYGNAVHDWGKGIPLTTHVLRDRMPFFPSRPGYTGDADAIYKKWKDSIAAFDGTRPMFLAAQGVAWRMTPGNIIKLKERLDSLSPGNIVFVRADHFFNLYNEANGHYFNLSLLPGIEVSDGRADLKETFLISRFAIRHGKYLRVETSIDDKDWKPVMIGASGTDFDITPVRARYVRVKTSGGEIEIYGKRVGQALDARVETGFEQLSRIQRLPLLYPNGTRKNRLISYDAAGGNGFGLLINTFKKYVDKHGDVVIFNAYGPGCLYRQQMNIWGNKGIGTLSKTIRIKYYFDDEPTPRIDAPVNDFFNGDYRPVDTPFTFKSARQFAISYYPFTFKKRLKVALSDTSISRLLKANIDEPQNWYQYDYLTYPAGTAVRTWSPATPDGYENAAKEQWENRGKDPKPATGVQVVEDKVSIEPGHAAVIFDRAGRGSIASIHLKLEPWDEETFYHTCIRMSWDGIEQPAIDVPLSYFFGGGGWKDQFKDKTLKTLLYGFDSQEHSFYCYFPMPYFQKAKIGIVNKSATRIDELAYSIGVNSLIDYPRNKTGYFMAKVTKDSCSGGKKIVGSPKVYSKPYETAFKETGHGQVVAVNMFSGNYWEDGDEFTYVDGSNTPQIHGDGTEDDFNQGWAGGKYQKPLWGSLNNGVKGSYRIHLDEPYVFYDSIDMHFENTTAKYRANSPRGRIGTPDTVVQTEFMVWYYKAAGGPSLHLTDSIDVGNSVSERQHEFSIAGQRRRETLTDCYDSYESADNYGQNTDDGRAFNGSISFDAAISPANEGVRLRNKINRKGNGIQLANVYVDGVRLPQPWYILSYSEQAARGDRSFDGWFESEYEIPVKYTKNKRKIRVKVEYARAVNNELNSYFIKVYSYSL